MQAQAKKEQPHSTQLEQQNKKELKIAGFDEIETPDADIVSLGSASYTKMLGKIYT